jgi:hypothetical protein
MFLSSHTMRPQVLLEKYDINGNLIEERELETGYKSDSHIIVEKKSKESKLIETQKFPFRSWNNNMLSYVSGAFQTTSAPTYFTTRTGVSTGINLTLGFNNYTYNIPIGYNNLGIAVGKNSGGYTNISADSSSLTDYNLKNPIGHGITSGTMWYSDSVYIPIYTSGSNTLIEHQRILANLTTESIHIGEMGIYAYTSYGSIDNTSTVLVARDVVDYTGSIINIDVQPNQTLLVRYNILISTSSLFLNYNWMKLITLNGYGYNSVNNYITPVGFKNYITYRGTNITGSILQSYSAPASAMATQEIMVDSSLYLTGSIDWYNSEKWLKFGLITSANCHTAYYMFGSQIKNTDITYLTNSVTSSYSVGLAVRCARVTNQYGISVHMNSGSLRLVQTNSTTTQTIVSTSVAKTYDIDTNYYIRFFVSESIVRVKSWVSGAAEPGTWEIDTTTTQTQVGSIGYVAYNGATLNFVRTNFNDINITYLDMGKSYTGTNSGMLPYNMFDSTISYYDTMEKVFALNAPANNDTCGILVGSSDKTDSNELIESGTFSHYDWRLNNQIYQGINENHLTYGAMNILTTTNSVYSKHIELYRNFTNNSISPITIREIGLYIYMLARTAYPGYIFINKYKGNEVCVGRVSTGTPLTLTPGQSVLVRMRLYFET